MIITKRLWGGLHEVMTAKPVAAVTLGWLRRTAMFAIGATRDGLSQKTEQHVHGQGVGKCPLYLKIFLTSFVFIKVAPGYICIIKNSHGEVRAKPPTAYHPRKRGIKRAGTCPSEFLCAVTWGLLRTGPWAAFRAGCGAWGSRSRT